MFCLASRRRGRAVGARDCDLRRKVPKSPFAPAAPNPREALPGEALRHVSHRRVCEIRVEFLRCEQLWARLPR